MTTESQARKDLNDIATVLRKIFSVDKAIDEADRILSDAKNEEVALREQIKLSDTKLRNLNILIAERTEELGRLNTEISAVRQRILG